MNIMQSLWIGRPLSLMERLSISSFLANGYDFHLYIYDKNIKVPPGVTIKDASEILPQNKIFTYEKGVIQGSYAAFANLFRYKLLFDKGGMWTDLDMVCLRPIDLEQEYIFSNEYVFDEKTQKGQIALRQCSNTLMKAPRQSTIMRSCFEKALNEQDRSTWGKTGTKLISAEVNSYGLEQFIAHPEAFCPINWWDWKNLIEPDYKFIPSPETYCIHLWNEMWRRQIKQRGKYGPLSALVNKIRYNVKRLYPPNTLLGQLQRKYRVQN